MDSEKQVPDELAGPCPKCGREAPPSIRIMSAQEVEALQKDVASCDACLERAMKLLVAALRREASKGGFRVAI